MSPSSSRSRVRILLVAALAVAVVLGGCGGDSKPLTKAQYISKGDALCSDFRTEITSLEADVQKNPKKWTGAKFYEALLGSARKVTQKFKDLKVPSTDTAVLKQYLAGQDRALKLVEQIVAAAKRGDNQTVGSLLGNNAALTQTQATLASSYGFKVCGANSAAAGAAGTAGSTR
jgi:hypothetical protein